MRSSCWKEWDSKVVFSDRPSSSDRGKTLVKGASTICSFYGGTEPTLDTVYATELNSDARSSGTFSRSSTLLFRLCTSSVTFSSRPILPPADTTRMY